MYRTGNLTRAARALALSQPAVSMHVKALEADLGKPLFVRLARGVQPTPLADTLARQVAGPLDELAATATGFHSEGDPLQAPLYLGGPADALAALVLPALAPLAARGLRLRATIGLTGELVTALGKGELDLVVATTPTRHVGVSLEPLVEETLVLVASPSLVTGPVTTGARVDDPQRAGDPERVDGPEPAHDPERVDDPEPAHDSERVDDLERVDGPERVDDPAALRDLPLVAFSEENPLVRRYWRTVFGTTSTPEPRVVIPDLRAVLAVVEAGGGWTVLPTYLADDAIARGTLRVAHQADPLPTNTLYLATRRSGRQPHVQAVRDHLVATMQAPPKRPA